MKTILVAIGALIVGALIVIFTISPAVFVARVLSPCGNDLQFCREVTVAPDASGKPTIQPVGVAEVRDDGEDHQGRLIRWIVTTSGYTFTENGIAFDKDPGEQDQAKDEFKKCAQYKSDPRIFCLKDQHKSQVKLWQYRINLNGPSGTLSSDPYILND